MEGATGSVVDVAIFKSQLSQLLSLLSAIVGLLSAVSTGTPPVIVACATLLNSRTKALLAFYDSLCACERNGYQAYFDKLLADDLPNATPKLDIGTLAPSARLGLIDLAAANLYAFRLITEINNDIRNMGDELNKTKN